MQFPTNTLVKIAFSKIDSNQALIALIGCNAESLRELHLGTLKSVRIYLQIYYFFLFLIHLFFSRGSGREREC